MEGDGAGGCPATEDRLAALEAVKDNILTVRQQLSTTGLATYCGAGQWTRIAYLNMSDPFQFCPPAWYMS